MTRKKKSTTKYEPRDFFAFNNSYEARKHPNYVFGEKDGKYKSFGLTHTPKKEYKSIPLIVNPNPKDKNQSHLQTRVLTTKKKYMSSPLKDWSWAKEDVGAVRHYKKQYRKRYNKKRR